MTYILFDRETGERTGTTDKPEMIAAGQVIGGLEWLAPLEPNLTTKPQNAEAI